MRALLLIVAAAVTVTACSGPGPASQARSRTVPPASAPPVHLERATPTDVQPWAYFAKYGIAIRAGSPAVLITVPEAWRQRAGIGWGNNLGVASSLRLPRCPGQPGAWDVYVGGFYLRSPSGCVPLDFNLGRQIATLTFAIGTPNCGSAGSGGLSGPLLR
jgi:hypothetical protein